MSFKDILKDVISLLFGGDPRAVLFKLLVYVLKELGEEIVAFIQRTQEQRADNPSLVAEIKRLVDVVFIEHPEWPWPIKGAYVSDAAMNYAHELRLDVERALVNGRVDLYLSKKREEVEAGAVVEPPVEVVTARPPVPRSIAEAVG